MRLGSFVLAVAASAFLFPASSAKAVQERDLDLDVVFLKWTPSDSPLTIDPVFASEVVLTAEEQRILRDKLSSGGTVVVSALCVLGDATEHRQRMVLVLRGPVIPERPVHLQTLGPRDADAIYFQGSHPRAWWTVRPWSGSNFDQRVHLHADATDPLRTLYTVDLANGGTTTGLAYVWERRSVQSWLTSPATEPQ